MLNYFRESNTKSLSRFRPIFSSNRVPATFDHPSKTSTSGRPLLTSSMSVQFGRGWMLPDSHSWQIAGTKCRIPDLIKSRRSRRLATPKHLTRRLRGGWPSGSWWIRPSTVSTKISDFTTKSIRAWQIPKTIFWDEIEMSCKSKITEQIMMARFEIVFWNIKFRVNWKLIVIQWKPLNVITDIVIIRLMLS
jgi:hypothetical protein